ncbi:ATP-dependent sacrificial sulfur transferase LarE [Fimbriiglobus ruber]|uniref:GMP synthase [glutamine-hydrolyzing] n=1 Tax=Fimbriiglobus ruber TaxID=1908690 RepID=A0A225DZH3_9BACT|nr:ATP-dependent sacrificial sulfur transferase LarE [Fimbriiglobus ruber]OWK43938.1 GMP synthase [glutamine-hydrolyzing] [Fimbriiglobus ruber]
MNTPRLAPSAAELAPGVAVKRDHLLRILRDLGGAAVAFSGGVDSAVVAAAAQMALGDRAVAVTADSPSVPRSELTDARRLAELIGIRHVVVPTHEFDNPDYQKNDGARCYHCKSELYTRIETLLPDLGVPVMCSGANLDDQGDYRPGLVAAAEHLVRHPLQEAGFTKADVRAVARAWGLPAWDKPASPCLSSRLAPGLAVTPERTERVERAEAHLRSLGLRECRVRYHEGDLARIEVPLAEVARFATDPVRGDVARVLKQLGFKYVSLDLDGFRSGSLNDLVSLEIKTRYSLAGAGGPTG